MWLPAVLLVAAYLAALAASGLMSRPRPSDLAVVLGNAVGADGRPSPRLRARLEAAWRLYRSGTVRRVLVSGGIEAAGSRDEAAVMAAYLRDRGVPGTAILLDHAGRTTLDTARNALAVVGPHAGIVVVSQWYHLPRAVLILRRLGAREVSADWPRWFELRDIYSLLREAVALPFYAFRPLGRSSRDGDGAAAGPPRPRP
ncbi:MAG: YdcF family protein [Gluconacetobacter diazotrophicus]|nr:YdcF family protein [Gluconacetobacter diazotrophicus]